ncbi:MAG: hypothetical protein HKN31_06350 [Pricia sp.]|nr:hypothetical protein [Pricia sp.]
MNLKTVVRKYWLPLLIFVWALFQLGLTNFAVLNAWKLGGYGMYSDYHPGTYYVWFETEDRRILARTTKLFESNPVFQKLVLECRTYPSSRNLQRVHNFFKQNEKERFKIEVWRLNFNSDSLKLNRILVNSYEE